VILIFAIFGRYILKFLGISVPALQTSGRPLPPPRRLR